MFGTMMATITNTKRRMLKDETCDPGLRRDFLRDFLVTFYVFREGLNLINVAQVPGNVANNVARDLSLAWRSN
jgi:hypothetical protein